jgi:hypothetical protein
VEAAPQHLQTRRKAVMGRRQTRTIRAESGSLLQKRTDYKASSKPDVHSRHRRRTLRVAAQRTFKTLCSVSKIKIAKWLKSVICTRNGHSVFKKPLILSPRNQFQCHLVPAVTIWILNKLAEISADFSGGKCSLASALSMNYHETR